MGEFFKQFRGSKEGKDARKEHEEYRAKAQTLLAAVRDLENRLDAYHHDNAETLADIKRVFSRSEIALINPGFRRALEIYFIQLKQYIDPRNPKYIELSAESLDKAQRNLDGVELFLKEPLDKSANMRLIEVLQIAVRNELNELQNIRNEKGFVYGSELVEEEVEALDQLLSKLEKVANATPESRDANQISSTLEEINDFIGRIIGGGYEERIKSALQNIKVILRGLVLLKIYRPSEWEEEK